MEINIEQEQILNCLINGLTNVEIGEELGYSPNTIKKRLRSLYEMFNVRGRTELVAKYKKRGLI